MIFEEPSGEGEQKKNRAMKKRHEINRPYVKNGLTYVGEENPRRIMDGIQITKTYPEGSGPTLAEFCLDHFKSTTLKPVKETSEEKHTSKKPLGNRKGGKTG